MNARNFEPGTRPRVTDVEARDGIMPDAPGLYGIGWPNVVADPQNVPVYRLFQLDYTRSPGAEWIEWPTPHAAYGFEGRAPWDDKQIRAAVRENAWPLARLAVEGEAQSAPKRSGKIRLELTVREADAVLRVLGRGEDEIVDGDIDGGAYEYDRAGLRVVREDLRRVKDVRARIKAARP